MQPGFLRRLRIARITVMNGKVTIKIGGSFLRYTEGLELAWRTVRRGTALGDTVLLVPGGGEAADLVRRWQQRWKLNDLQAHELAIAAMELNAELLLRAWHTYVRPLRDLDDVTSGPGGLYIVRPTTCVPAAETRTGHSLPPSWDVTSDSIAYLIAYAAGCERLVLVKHIAARMISSRSVGGEDVVDRYFGKLVASLPGVRVDVVDPRREGRGVRIA